MEDHEHPAIEKQTQIIRNHSFHSYPEQHSIKELRMPKSLPFGGKHTHTPSECVCVDLFLELKII